MDLTVNILGVLCTINGLSGKVYRERCRRPYVKVDDIYNVSTISKQTLSKLDFNILKKIKI